VKWYEKAVDNTEEGTEDPSYLLKARLAEMYLSGGFGLQKDPCKAGEQSLVYFRGLFTMLYLLTL